MKAAADKLRELLTPALVALGHLKEGQDPPSIEFLPWKGLYTDDWGHTVCARVATLTNDDLNISITAITVDAAYEQILGRITDRITKAIQLAREREDAARADRIRWDSADDALSEMRRAADIAHREERDALDTPETAT
jgi:hypothetical protein